MGDVVDYERVVSRVVTAINVPVDLANSGEDALRTEIIATVPNQLLFIRALAIISLNEVTIDTNISQIYHAYNLHIVYAKLPGVTVALHSSFSKSLKLLIFYRAYPYNVKKLQVLPTGPLLV